MYKKKVLSEEHKKKIGLANKGKTRSEEARRKYSIAKMGRPLSVEHRRKISEAQKRIGNRPPSALGRIGYFAGKKKPGMSGKNAPGWRGGVSSSNHIIRHSLEYRLWRKAVFERDNWTCVWCGVKSRTTRDASGKWIDINADHIKPFSLYPELRFALDNGRTLCVPCHRTTDTFGNFNPLKK